MKSQKGISLLKLVIIIAVILFAIILLFGGSDNTNTSTPTSQKNQSNVQTLKVGDTWTVDGQWSLTIHSLTPTSNRNPYSDKNPNQVFLITYSYQNIGYYNNFYNEDKLFFDLEPNGDATYVDSNGELAYSYPADKTGYAQETPQGAKCTNAQAVIAVNNISNSLTMTLEKHDSNGNNQKVKYILDVK